MPFPHSRRAANRIALTVTVLCAGLGATASPARAEGLVNITNCQRVGNTMRCTYDDRDNPGLFTVPTGVSALTITLHGGNGGRGGDFPNGTDGGPGGPGGTASVTRGSPLTDPGTKLAVYLGGHGQAPAPPSDSPDDVCEEGGAPGVTAGIYPTAAPQAGKGGSGGDESNVETTAYGLPSEPDQIPARCAGGGGGAASFVMHMLDTENLPNGGETPVVAAGGGGGGGGGGGFVQSAADAARVGGKGGPGAQNGMPETNGGKSGEDQDNPGAGGPDGGASQSGGTGGVGDDSDGGGISNDGNADGGGGGGYRVGGGGGSNGAGGGGGCGYTPEPNGFECAEVESDAVRRAEKPSGGPTSGAFRATEIDYGVIFSWSVPPVAPPAAHPPPPPADGPGSGGEASNDPNPNTNPENYERIRRSIGPNTVTAICRPGQVCTVEPPAGPDSGFAIAGSDGSRQAILFATLNGNYRPASTEAGKAPEGRPDCPGYRERNRDWVQFGFVDENDGATWRKIGVMTQRQKLKKAAAAKLARELQICFAAPYAFPTREGYRLGTNGPDRVGVLPDCPSANRVRTAVGRPAPCVASREVVAVEGGWVVRLTFKIPASDKDRKALG